MVRCGVAMCGVGTNVAVVSAEEESSHIVEIRLYRKTLIIHGDKPKRVKKLTDSLFPNIHTLN